MRTGPLLLAVAVLLALAGCVPSDSPVTSAPSASATPLFASDADALAAAEKAYAAYLKVSDEIANDGGSNPTRIKKFATGQLQKDDLAGFDSFRTKGWHSTGSSRIQNMKLQSADPHAGGSTQLAVSAYVCEDISGVDVLDSGGASVVSPSRPDFQVFEVDFDLVQAELIPSDRQVWTGADPCA